MKYGVLGELELYDAAGDLIDLPRGHDLAVLAALLIRPNRQLSSMELLKAGWGDPDISVAQLHKTICALRKLFTAAGRPGAVRTHTRFGYELTAAEDDHDMLVFSRLVEQADADKAARRTSDEIAHIREALHLWRGPQPLVNVPGDPFHDAVDALKRRRKRIAVRLFSLENSRGEHGAILDDLEQFAAEDPTDAQLCRQLMIALYLSGHGTDATGAFQRHAQALEQETGGRPDTGLRQLHFAMLNHNDEAVAKAAAAGENAEPPARPVPAVPRQLPAAPADFTGRGDLRAEVTWLLRRPVMPVLVISGPGGIGKTAMALRAAHDAVDDYPDGQLWAELRGTTEQPADPSELLAQFLRALGVPAVPEARDERASLFRSLLADRRMLIVLDDAASGTQIRDLIPGGRACVVLVTARRRLPNIHGGVHHVAPLEPFDHATATELFRGIVTAANVDLRGEERAVDEVVRLCGGLPLALRIAASLRVEDFHRPTADLLRRLREQGPTALEYGDDSLARTLGAGLAPLDERARRLFFGLGLLTLPTFGEWTAAALLDDPGPAGGVALSQLATVSMVEPVDAGVRYRFHDLTREYAREQAMAGLVPAREREEAPARVCRALLTLTRRAHAALYGGDFEVVHSDLPDVPVAPAGLSEACRAPTEWFDRERANIRAAVEQAAALGLADLCWDLAVSAHEFYTIGGYFDDWRATHEVALFVCRQAGDRRGEGMVLVSLGQPPLVASGIPGVSGVAELETAVQLLGDTGERHGQAIALRTLANALRRRGELNRPLALFAVALDHYEHSGDPVGSLQTLRFIGQTHLDLRDFDQALVMLRRAEDMAVLLDRPRLLAQTRYWTGRACLARGDLTAAGAAFRAVLAASEKDTDVGRAYALHGLGDLALAGGAPDVARRYLTEAVVMAHDAADALLEGRIGLSIAALEAAQGRRAEEIVALLRAVARFQSCGAIHLEIEAQASLASAQARVGDTAAAEAAEDRISELYAVADVPMADRLHGGPDA
ncbi:MAG TPA: BTAD domain-containing putative transcriptional regulator [Actinoplanes sp.]